MGSINVQGGGFDIRKYKPTSVLSNPTLTSTYQTILSVTGEGFINHAAVSTDTGTGGASRAFMKITADGVVLFEGSAVTAASVLSFTGVIDPSKLTARDSGNANRIAHTSTFGKLTLEVFSDSNLPTTREIPYTGASDGIAYIDVPISFKESLLIECKAATTSVISKILILGGVKV